MCSLKTPLLALKTPLLALKTRLPALKTLLPLLLLAGPAAGLGRFNEWVEFSGACPAIEPMERINLKRFMGHWRVFKMYIAASNTPLKCISEQYYNLNAGIFSITRRGVQVQDAKTVEEEWIAIPVSVRRSDRIRARFRLSLKGSATDSSPDYEVLFTDYVNVAIAWNCIPGWRSGTNWQSLALLTRKSLPKRRFKKKMNRRLRKLVLNRTVLVKIDQRSC